MTYPLVTELAEAGIPVTVSCRVLKLARQPYYRWRNAPVRDADLLRAHRINALRDAHDDDPTFGYRYLAGEARRAGWRMSRRTAWKLCSQAGILSSAQRRRRGKGKKAGPPVFDDHVQRVFRADAPNRLWLTDITEHWTTWIPAVVATPSGELSWWRRRSTPTSRRKSSSGFLIEAGLFEQRLGRPGFTRTLATTGSARRG